EEPGDRPLLLADVDQHRAGGNDVDGCSGYGAQVVGGRQDELAAVRDPEVACDRPALVEQRLRDVGEDDLPGSPFDRAEGNEAVAAADVEQRFAGLEGGVVEDPVARLRELSDGPRLELGVTAGAPSA